MLKHIARFAAMLALLSLWYPQASFGSGLILAQAQPTQPTDNETNKKAKLVDFWQPGDAGQRMNIRGRVTSLDGTPLSGVGIDIRQSDGNGDYSERYSATLRTDAKGRYQYGSVIPGNYIGLRHVHVSAYHEGYQYFDSRILFKGDPNLDGLSDAKDAIFLEESTVNKETIHFGRFDIVLVPR